MTTRLAAIVRPRTLVFALVVAAVAARPAVVSPLVSIEWLAQHRTDPQVVIVDFRSAIDGGGTDALGHSHIPGAVHSDYDKAGWRVTRGGVPFTLPTVPELEKLICGHNGRRSALSSPPPLPAS